MQEFEINKVQMIIREFGDEVCDILSDAEACQRWLKDFHDGLLYRRTGRSPFADKLLAEAAAFGRMKRLAGQKGGFAKAARKKNSEAPASQKSLPGTSSGNGEALNDEGDTAPAGQHLDGDAATREGAEAATSGFATSPSDIQKRPGKSATTSYCVEDSMLIHDGGSERGAGGTAIDAVRRSPGAGKEPEVPTLEGLYAFASDACLNEMLCREWWEMTYGDRAGLDRAGRPIRNWKAACRAYVKKRISNMENER